MLLKEVFISGRSSILVKKVMVLVWHVLNKKGDHSLLFA